MFGLAVDTSSKIGSFALCELSSSGGLNIVDTLLWQKKNSHSEVITPFCQEFLKKNNLSLHDLGMIGLGIGPGSFTGIRVALNFSKALSYSLEIPIFSCNSLLPLARPIGELTDLKRNTILVAQNAFKNMIYCSVYEANPFKEIIPPFSCRPSEIESFVNINPEETVLVGDGFDLYAKEFPLPLLSGGFRFKEPSNIAENILLYFGNCERPQLEKWNQIIPLYIRKSEAEEKLGL